MNTSLILRLKKVRKGLAKIKNFTFPFFSFCDLCI